MLADVLTAASEVPFARRMIATESEVVRKVARSAGAETLHVNASGTNDAALAAVSLVVAAGAERLLLLAADLPYLTSSDLEMLVAERAPVVIAPDRHRRGTNALLLCPPYAIPPAFGEDSFRLHREAALRASLDASIVTSHGLATDVDNPEDLRLLLSEPGLGPRTSEVLRSTASSRS
jgi:2-phospho-L-lactate guanylyltransferase